MAALYPYLKAFVVGGLICAGSQLLIDYTRLTPARILTLLVVLGVLLGALGLYQPLVEFAGAGATVPLMGFGSALAKGVKKAVEEAGVTFVISYPQRGRPCVQFAKKMMEEGAFGKVTLVRTRDAHSGVSGNWLPDYWFDKSAAAGGAMMDLGCHPMYLLAWFLGRPKRVTGLFTAPYGKPVDENAVAIAEFADGALGVAETGFISAGSPQTLEIYGTEGSLISHGEDVTFQSSKYNDIHRGAFKPSLPEGKPAPILQFIDAVAAGTGSPEGLGIDDAIALTELLENAYKGDENNAIEVIG